MKLFKQSVIGQRLSDSSVHNKKRSQRGIASLSTAVFCTALIFVLGGEFAAIVFIFVMFAIWSGA